MLTYFLMISAFLIILGVALLYINLLKLNIGESYVLATVTLIAMIYATGLIFQNLLIGRRIFCILAAAGAISSIIQVVRKRFDWEKLTSSYLPLLFSILILSIIMYHGDFIRYIDELHMWAAAPKYMLATNNLPLYDDFAGVGSRNIGTSIFHYYTQSFIGYNEGMMYVSGSLLAWIALLLPVSNKKARDTRFISVLYALILFIGMPVLYIHGFKSVYVDVPVAAWIGGLAGWCLSREKKWQNVLLIVAVLWVAYPFKDNVGLTLDCFFLLFFLLTTLLAGKKSSKWIKSKKGLIIAGSMVLIALLLMGSLITFAENYDLLMVLPGPLKMKLAASNYSYDTVRETIRAVMNMAIGGSLTISSARLKISFMTAVMICILIIILYGYVNKRQQESVLYISYALVCTIMYLILTLCVYLFGMAKIHAIRAWAGHRYLAIFVLYLFVLCLCLLLFHTPARKSQNKLTLMTGLLLLLFFAYGIRDQGLTYFSSFADRENKDHYELKEQKRQAEAIQKEIGKEKKVYFLNQKNERFDEFAMNPAYYYMGKQINDVWWTPWQYTQDGAIIKYSSYGNVKIADILPVLGGGGYSYLWIYRTNDYLNRTLPQVVPIYGCESENERKGDSAYDTSSVTEIEKDNPANIVDGQLYEIIYGEHAIITGLKLVKNLVPYDNRKEYITE